VFVSFADLVFVSWAFHGLVMVEDLIIFGVYDGIIFGYLVK
jgi:hypothetical protein